MKTINKIFWPVIIIIGIIVVTGIFCSGQSITTLRPLPKDSVVIAMQIKGDNLRQIRETFLSSFKGTSLTYDSLLVYLTESEECHRCKYLIRLKYSSGPVHDLTFEQFKIIVYP